LGQSFVCGLPLALIAQAAAADEGRVILAQDINFSAVCWQNPNQDGWIDVSHHAGWIPSGRYGLLVRLQERPIGPLPFSSQPYEYRLTYNGSPCFFEYSSHQYRGYGTLLNVYDADFGDIVVDGMTFPRIEADELVEPIIHDMLVECGDLADLSPWMTMDGCESLVSGILLSETTSIMIHSEREYPEQFETIIFVKGIPFRGGEMVYPLDVSLIE